MDFIKDGSKNIKTQRNSKSAYHKSASKKLVANFSDDINQRFTEVDNSNPPDSPYSYLKFCRIQESSSKCRPEFNKIEGRL